MVCFGTGYRRVVEMFLRSSSASYLETLTKHNLASQVMALLVEFLRALTFDEGNSAMGLC